jgi:hypothetical protein
VPYGYFLIAITSSTEPFGHAYGQALHHAGLNAEFGSLALGEVRQVRLLCEPYVRQLDVLVPNTNSTDCVPLTKEGVEGEYSPLVCPNPAVTEVDTSDANWLVRYLQATARQRCMHLRALKHT